MAHKQTHPLGDRILALLSLSLVIALPPVMGNPGALDPTFDTDGRVTTAFGSGNDISESVAVQSDGKIVVGGVTYTTGSTGDFALARYTASGSLDTTFGAGTGKVTTSFGAGVATIWSVAIYGGSNAGKILAAGDSTATGRNFFALARYNADGSLDPTFGTGGKVTTDFGSPGDISPLAQGFEVVLQSDGKIVVAGAFFKFYSTNWNFALARYNADGSLDVTFGLAGKVITDFAGGNDAANSVAIQSDGRIVAAGYAGARVADDYPFTYFALARYTIDGTLDTTFGGGTGKVTTDFAGNDYGYSVKLQADGKIVVAGQTGDYPSTDFALARYNFDGSLDTSFDTDGKVTTNFGGYDLGQSVAIQLDGAIVMAGHTQAASFALDFAVARYDASGTLDASFDTDGKVTTDFGGGPDAGHSVVIQSDGKIVVAGSGGATNTDFAVARYAGTLVVTNQSPLAAAGADQVVDEGATVQLDASGSSDPDANPLTFNWTVVSSSGPAITLSSSAAANPTFSALDDGAYTLRVTVSDGNGGVASDDVQVTVRNVVPTVNAGADQSLQFGALVNISASFADPGASDSWTYSINWGDGSPVTTGSATVGSPIIGSHQYLVAGNQTITVCVTDDNSGQGCDSLTVNFVGGIAKITGGVLRFGNNGRGGFNVQSVDGVTVKGSMQYQNGAVNLHARSLATLGVSADLKQGWFSGVLDDGRKFAVYVEDNGEPGKNDIFKIWVEGVLLNGTGNLTGGNVQIHR